MLCYIYKKRERERERSCFRFKRRDFDFDFENSLKPKVMKSKIPIVTSKILDFLSFCWERSLKKKQIYNDLIYPLQSLFAARAQTHIDWETERQYWKERWKFSKKLNRKETKYIILVWSLNKHVDEVGFQNV